MDRVQTQKNRTLSLKTPFIFLLIFFTFFIEMNVYGLNAANGVDGGYVGSDQWFAMMRKSADNWALYKSLSGTVDYRKLPQDCIELAGVIVFQGGNPFSDKRMPDLRIRCHNPLADNVERVCHLDRQGGFYTVLKKSQTYDFYWIDNSGNREIFKSVTVNNNGPKQRKATFEYNSRKLPSLVPQQNQASSQVQSQPEQKSVSQESPLAIQGNSDQFDLSGFPNQPANFQEQLIEAAMQAAATPQLKAFAHQMLGDYYFKKGEIAKAEVEYSKAKEWWSVNNEISH